MFDDLNYTAIVVATIVTFVIGFLWYGPFFGKEWMKLVGLKQSDVKGPMAGPMIKGLISSFVTITVLAYVLEMTGASTWQDGALQGVVLAVGFVAAVLYGEVNWEGRPTKLYMINTLYWVVTLAVASGIYVSWPA